MMNSNKKDFDSKIVNSYSKIEVDDNTSERMLGDIVSKMQERKEKKSNKLFVGVVCIQAVIVAALIFVVVINGNKSDGRQSAKNTENKQTLSTTGIENTTEITTSAEEQTSAVNNNQYTEAIMNAKDKLGIAIDNFYIQQLLMEGSLEKVTNEGKLWYTLSFADSLEDGLQRNDTESVTAESLKSVFDRSCISNLGLTFGDIGYFGDTSKVIYRYDKDSNTFKYDNTFGATGYPLAYPVDYVVTDITYDGKDTYKAEVKMLFIQDMVNEDYWKENTLYSTYKDAIDDTEAINDVQEFLKENPQGTKDEYYHYVLLNNKNLKTMNYTFVINELGNVNFTDYSIN